MISTELSKVTTTKAKFTESPTKNIDTCTITAVVAPSGIIHNNSKTSAHCATTTKTLDEQSDTEQQHRLEEGCAGTCDSFSSGSSRDVIAHCKPVHSPPPKLTSTSVSSGGSVVGDKEISSENKEGNPKCSHQLLDSIFGFFSRKMPVGLTELLLELGCEPS